MASKTEIANRALYKLGQSRVSNINDNITNARVLNDIYDTVRNSLLTSYPWNFAIKRAQLVSNSVAPAWGYNKSYTLPPDFLALLLIKGYPDYRIERDNDGDIAILTDEGSPIYIKYVSLVEEEGRFDALFVEAFATKLAYEGCEKIVESNTKKQILSQEFKQNIKEAYASDAIQDPPESARESEWVLSRDSYYEQIDYGTS